MNIKYKIYSLMNTYLNLNDPSLDQILVTSNKFIIYIWVALIQSK